MTEVIEVILLDAEGVIDDSLKRLLESDATPFRLQVLPAEPAARPIVPPPDVVILTPRHWEELERWLPWMRQAFPEPPWLVWADLCLAGMFVTAFEEHCCTLVATHWQPADLLFSLRALATRHPVCPPARLPGLFLDHLPADTPYPLRLTTRQFECGCGVAMGLRNRRIGQLLHIEEATVRDHLNNLFRALAIHDREELARLFRHTLASLPPPF